MAVAHRAWVVTDRTWRDRSRWEITTVESTGPTVSFGLGSLQVAVQFLLELLQGWEAHHSKGVWFLLLGSSFPCVLLGLTWSSTSQGRGEGGGDGRGGRTWKSTKHAISVRALSLLLAVSVREDEPGCGIQGGKGCFEAVLFSTQALTNRLEVGGTGLPLWCLCGGAMVLGLECNGDLGQRQSSAGGMGWSCVTGGPALPPSTLLVQGKGF